jgi:hypothetical protein
MTGKSGVGKGRREIGELGIIRVLADGRPRSIGEILSELNYKWRQTIQYHLYRKSDYTGRKKSLMERGLVKVVKSISFPSKEIKQFAITPKGTKYLRSLEGEEKNG